MELVNVEKLKQQSVEACVKYLLAPSVVSKVAGMESVPINGNLVQPYQEPSFTYFNTNK